MIRLMEILNDFLRGITSDKVLHDKAFTIAKNPKYDKYQRGLVSVIYNVFDKKSSNIHKGKIINYKNQRPLDVAEELHQPIIRKFEKRKVCSSYKDDILGADLADMQLRSKRNTEFQFLLCAINIYSKYAWVVLLKDKKAITITNTLQKFLDEPNCKANKIRVYKGS